MTITQLLELPTERLEAMSDADLEAVLSKYWPDTRPDAGRSAQMDMLIELQEKLRRDAGMPAPSLEMGGPG